MVKYKYKTAGNFSLWFYAPLQSSSAVLFFPYSWWFYVDVAGANTVRFKAEINFDGREITRRHLSRKEPAQLLQVSVFSAG